MRALPLGRVIAVCVIASLFLLDDCEAMASNHVESLRSFCSTSQRISMAKACKCIGIKAIVIPDNTPYVNVVEVSALYISGHRLVLASLGKKTPGLNDSVHPTGPRGAQFLGWKI